MDDNSGLTIVLLVISLPSLTLVGGIVTGVEMMNIVHMRIRGAFVNTG
jgi:hypothetical protein